LGHQAEPGQYEENWYRATQGVYIFSKTNNTKRHLGDELDVIWTHLFIDGTLSFQAGYGHIFAGGYIAKPGHQRRSGLGVCAVLGELLAGH